jgi:hypothetical protein
MNRTRTLVLAALVVSMAALGGAYIVAAQDLAGTLVDGAAVNGTATNVTGCPGGGPMGGPHGGFHGPPPPWLKPADNGTATSNETA